MLLEKPWGSSTTTCARPWSRSKASTSVRCFSSNQVRFLNSTASWCPSDLNAAREALGFVYHDVREAVVPLESEYLSPVLLVEPGAVPELNCELVPLRSECCSRSLGVRLPRRARGRGPARKRVPQSGASRRTRCGS